MIVYYLEKPYCAMLNVLLCNKLNGFSKYIGIRLLDQLAKVQDFDFHQGQFF